MKTTKFQRLAAFILLGSLFCIASLEVNAQRANFRVTLNGFDVTQQSLEGLRVVDGMGDEVFFINQVTTVDASGGWHPIDWSLGSSSTIGANPPNSVRGGTASSSGGLVSGDKFPGATVITGPAIPPTILFEGEIVRNTNAVLIIPTIWESDGATDLRLSRGYQAAIFRDREVITRNVAGMIVTPRALALNSFLFSGGLLGIGGTVDLAPYIPQDRPIGLHYRSEALIYNFTPQTLVLTYEAADYISRTDFGEGVGIVSVRYTDPSPFMGDYTLYLKVENVSGNATGGQSTGGATGGQPNGASPTVGSPSVGIENAFGLVTATFNTPEGTVAVNLPDDIAAGDSISGTVIAKPNGKSGDEQAKNQDALSGLVVEIAQQDTPLKKDGGNPAALCTNEDSAPTTKDYSLTICKKLPIPENVSKIPILLRNKEGKIVARTEVPVGPKPNITEAQTPSGMPQSPPKYSTPAVGQGGKPISVTGVFDGDFASTAIKLGNQTAKFLASSPRKVVVESPRDLKGVSDIEVTYKGKPVAKCTYRSITIRLAADKLNLTKGEQTTLTVTLAGLIGLLTPVDMQVTNRSPETVSLSGGESQTITVDPAAVNGDTFVAKRTLTGVQAGGFSINAVVDPLKVVPAVCSALTPIGSPGNPQPQTTPQPTPQPVGTQQPSLRRFRITLFKFRVNNQTVEGVRTVDGRGDEVAVLTHVGMVDLSGRVNRIMWGNTAGTVMGEHPPNGLPAGSLTDLRQQSDTGVPILIPGSGGLQTGDQFYGRSIPLNEGDLPTQLFEGDLAPDNSNAVFVIPTIWEWDYANDLNLIGNYVSELNESSPALGAQIVNDNLRTRQPLETGNFLRTGEWTRIRNVLRLPYGLPQDRPIGMQMEGTQFGFTPQVLVLTYAAADAISERNNGLGRGIFLIRYVDHPSLGGDYTLFIHVERPGRR